MIELVDYSDDYYAVHLKGAVPEVRQGKFVQMRNEKSGQEFLLLSPKEFSPYHSDIVERFCRSKGIKGSRNQTLQIFVIDDESWDVLGGGLWGINSRDKILMLAGSSQAYGRFVSGGLDAKIAALKQFAGYTINIE